MKDYNHDMEAQQRSKEGLAALQADADAKRTALEQWCITSYGEVGSGA